MRKGQSTKKGLTARCYDVVAKWEQGHDAQIVQEHRCVRIMQGVEQGVQGQRMSDLALEELFMIGESADKKIDGMYVDHKSSIDLDKSYHYFITSRLEGRRRCWPSMQ